MLPLLRGRSSATVLVVVVAALALVVGTAGAVALWSHQHHGASGRDTSARATGASGGSGGGSGGAPSDGPSGTVPTPGAGGQSALPGLGNLASKAQAQAEALARSEHGVALTVANFNALGASHTTARGKDSRMASGAQRGAWAGRILLANHVDVVALQEFQRSQAVAFSQAVGATYDVWPGTTGSGHDGENSVAWRKDRFTLVRTVRRTYPYFYGRPRLFPLVLLRDRASGTEFWVTSFHNPANTAEFGNQAVWKALALSREIPDIQRLLATTRLPLLVAGDMNDRGGFFCPVVARTTLHAANGGSSDGSGCQVPAPHWIDWIMGSPEVSFSGYRWDHGAAVRATSDHPLVLAQAVVRRGAGQP